MSGKADRHSLEHPVRFSQSLILLAAVAMATSCTTGGRARVKVSGFTPEQ